MSLQKKLKMDVYWVLGSPYIIIIEHDQKETWYILPHDFLMAKKEKKT